MLLKNTGFPPEESLVLCTVTGINPHSVFCTLDEYGGRTGMIHISEIAPGRIKNIREYVQQGKKVVCKVLQINQEKGHIDLSLRRVSQTQKQAKLNDIKQQQLAEKIVEQAAKQLGDAPLTFFTKVSEKIVPQFGNLITAFEKVAHDTLNLETLLDKKAAKALTDLIKTRIKPPQVTIGGDLMVTSYEADGLQEVKDALKVAVTAGITVRYLGAGTYHFQITAEDYKTAEKKLKEGVEGVLHFAKKHDMESKWTRKED